jgi:tetratricopeptide (TPR) repeat protein
VVFSPDGQRLASASWDGTVKVWEASSGKELHTLRGHTPGGLGAVGGILASHSFVGVGVTHLVFSPDGRRLASAGAEGMVILWESVFEPASLEPRWQVWRAQQAKRSEETGHWFAAAFHLSRLIDKDPGAANLYFRRANVLAESAKWKDAESDLAKVIEIDPHQTAPWTRRALVLLQCGDDETRHQVLSEAFRRFSSTTDPAVANTIAWMCVIQPWKRGHQDDILALAQRSVKLRPNNYNLLNTLGAALYRAGRFDASVLRLNEAMSMRGQAVGTMWDYLFLSMAEHRLGNADKAKEWLQKAVNVIERSQSTLSWDQRLEMRLLRDEAEAVLKSREPPGRPEGDTTASETAGGIKELQSNQEIHHGTYQVAANDDNASECWHCFPSGLQQ